jgi:hypothetical protein
MKYGQKLVEQSVPKWSLHNVDYNSLKHEIKVHTTRDQARAIAIPGQDDRRLARFESRLYGELCAQHQRVGLFVVSKAGELERRLENTARSTQRIIALNDQDGIAPRRQRKLIKYERALLEIGADISALERFTNAQVEAFRKILKKYRKWTGSTDLGTRFREKILRSDNSFTRLRFDGLCARHDDILATLHGAVGLDSDSSAPISPVQPSAAAAEAAAIPPSPLERRARFDPDPVACTRGRYWNEYDDGSDCGNDDEYVIYITPESDDDDDDWTIPGLAHLTSVLTLPYERARMWFGGRGRNRRHGEHNPPSSGDDDADANERRHLLSSAGHATDTDYTSDDNVPSSGSSVYGALWIDRQREAHRARRTRELRARERVLQWASRGSFAAALVLLVVEVLMLGTGRPEVDLAVAVAAAASLSFAVVGLWAGGSWARERVSDREALFLGEREDVLAAAAAMTAPTPEARLMRWAAFVVAVVLNLMVLAVAGNNLGEFVRLG